MPTEQLTKCFEQFQKPRTGFVYETNSVNIHIAMTIHFLMVTTQLKQHGRLNSCNFLH